MITVFDMSAPVGDDADVEVQNKVVRSSVLSSGLAADALMMQRWQQSRPQTQLRLLTIDEAMAQDARSNPYRR